MASIAQQLARNEMILGGLMSKSPRERRSEPVFQFARARMGLLGTYRYCDRLRRQSALRPLAVERRYASPPRREGLGGEECLQARGEGRIRMGSRRLRFGQEGSVA